MRAEEKKKEKKMNLVTLGGCVYGCVGALGWGWSLLCVHAKVGLVVRFGLVVGLFVFDPLGGEVRREKV